MKFLITLFLMIFVGTVSAQDSTLTRNPTVKEIQGNWELLPFPPSLEPQGASNPWPSECQLFGFSSSGPLKSVDKLRGPCESMTSAQADKVFAAVPSVVTWQYYMKPGDRKAVIIVKRSDEANYTEVWGPEIITKTFLRDGVEFKQGDLLLSLISSKDYKVVWIRHLRRLE